PVRDFTGRELGRYLPDVRGDPAYIRKARLERPVRPRRAGLSPARCGAAAPPTPGGHPGVETPGPPRGARGDTGPARRRAAPAGVVPLLELARDRAAGARPRRRRESDPHEDVEQIEQLLVPEIPLHETRDQKPREGGRDAERNRRAEALPRLSGLARG